ncbi:hypothetical protein CAJAP_02643 [Camponotus japonicus]
MNRIQWIEQTETKNVNNNKTDCVKFKDIENITNETTPSLANQRNNVDSYINDEIENNYYEAAEGKNAVKYVEHFVKNMKHIVDQNPAKPKNYDEWTNEERYKHITENIKIYVPNLPDSLLFFISAALYRGDCGRSSTDRPLWLDMDEFRRGQKFARQHIFSIIFSNVLSLFELFAFTDGLKPIIFNQQSYTPLLAFNRYLSTVRRVKSWMMEDFWNENTQAHKHIQIVRKMHRAVRLKLCEYEYKEIDAATRIPNPWCPDRKIILDDFSSCPYANVENGCFHLIIRPKGLNQADMSATQFAFMGMILLYSHKFGIHATDEDMMAFCHVWRNVGYALGIQDEYNFCSGSLQEIKTRARDFTQVWVKPYLRQILPEWEHMLRCVMYDDNMFKFSILFVADLLDIDMPHMRSTLTFFQRLQFMLYRFLLCYAMRLRFVREYMNKKTLKILDKPIKISSKRYEKLKTISVQMVPDLDS